MPFITWPANRSSVGYVCLTKDKHSLVAMSPRTKSGSAAFRAAMYSSWTNDIGDVTAVEPGESGLPPESQR